MKKIRSTFAILAAAMVFSLTATAQTSLTSTTGAKVDIEGQKGKVVVLAIGASWLPLSGKQAEYTNALAKKYAGKNVVIYFVATDSTSPKSKNFASNDDLTAFAAKNKLTVPILRDSDGASTLKKFDIDQVPSFVVLDKDGKISGSPFGGIDPKFDVTVPISKEIDKLL